MDPPANVRNRLKNKKRRHRILRAGDHRQLDQESQGPGLDAMSQLHRWLQLKCMMIKSQEEGVNQLLVRRKGSMIKQNAIKLNRDHPASLQLFYQFKGVSCHRRRYHLKAVQGVVLFSVKPIPTTKSKVSKRVKSLEPQSSVPNKRTTQKMAELLNVYHNMPAAAQAMFRSQIPLVSASGRPRKGRKKKGERL